MLQGTSRFIALKHAVLTVAVVLLVATGATAQTFGNTAPNARVQECFDAWSDAPASSYCTGVQVNRIGASPSGGEDNCYAVQGSCSITANVGETSTTWTPSLTEEDTSTSVTSFSTIDFCFKVKSDDEDIEYHVTVKAGCATDETTSADATSDGLPDPTVSSATE